MDQNMTDERLERLVSALLRTGVLISGTVVLAGGILYLAQRGRELVEYQHFQSEPAIDRAVGLVIRGVLRLRPESVIQLGVLLLIATPIFHVLVSLVGFALERDRTYVLITAIVLATLIYGLVRGAAAA